MELFFDWRCHLGILISLFIHWGVLRSARTREYFLLATSLLFLFWLHPIYALLTVIASCGVYQATTAGRSAKRVARWLLFSVISLVAWKLLAPTWRLLSPASPAIPVWLVPLGVSYLIFRWIQCLADAYRGVLRREPLPRFLLFLFFFPTLPAGPLETIDGFFTKKLEKLSLADGTMAVERIVLGFFLKLVLADCVLALLLKHAAFPFDPHSSRWHVMLWAALQLVRVYCDLAGYTGLALGIALLFGYRIVDNFHRPFLQPTLADFWRHWHISLSQFCRNQVYFPLLGISRGPLLAAVSSMVVMGAWHALSWNWIGWGIYHGVGLWAYGVWHRAVGRNLVFSGALAGALGKVRWSLGVVLTLTYVALGHLLVSTKDFQETAMLVRHLTSTKPVERRLPESPVGGLSNSGIVPSLPTIASGDIDNRRG